MKTVEIYTTPTCPYCIAAKALLTRKGVAYDETDVGAEPVRHTVLRYCDVFRQLGFEFADPGPAAPAVRPNPAPRLSDSAAPAPLPAWICSCGTL